MQVTPNKPAPAHLKLGAGAHYTRIDVVADLLGSTEKDIMSLLGIFGIPAIHLPGREGTRYVLTYALESAMFGLGMPKKIKEKEDLLRVHQELAGVLYGTLTKEAMKERVKLLIKTLTSSDKKPKIGERRRRPQSQHRTWSGRKPS
jgi:hypothetical protein